MRGKTRILTPRPFRNRGIARIPRLAYNIIEVYMMAMSEKERLIRCHCHIGCTALSSTSRF